MDAGKWGWRTDGCARTGQTGGRLRIASVGRCNANRYPCYAAIVPGT